MSQRKRCPNVSVVMILWQKGGQNSNSIKNIGQHFHSVTSVMPNLLNIYSKMSKITCLGFQLRRVAVWQRGIRFSSTVFQRKYIQRGNRGGSYVELHNVNKLTTLLMSRYKQATSQSCKFNITTTKLLCLLRWYWTSLTTSVVSFKWDLYRHHAPIITAKPSLMWIPQKVDSVQWEKRPSDFFSLKVAADDEQNQPSHVFSWFKKRSMIAWDTWCSAPITSHI